MKILALIPLFFLLSVTSVSAHYKSSSKSASSQQTRALPCPNTSTNWCIPSVSIPANSTTPDHSDPLCSRQLHQIVFIPENAARNYLSKISIELISDLAGLGDPMNMQIPQSTIMAFVNKYNVDVYLQGEMSTMFSIKFTPGSSTPTVETRFVGHLIAPTYINLQGFETTRDTNGAIDRYAMASRADKALYNSYTFIVTTSARSHLFYNCN